MFLRSQDEVRYIRLTPLSQVAAMAGVSLAVGWLLIATAILMMDSVGAGALRDQAAREQALYETRLNQMAAERDSRAAEAVQAQERFNVALQKVSEMQSALLASEQRRAEMETGIDVIQATLRRTMAERDAARRELAARAEAQMADGRTPEARAADMEDTLDFLLAALEETSEQRDTIADAAQQARREVEHLQLEARLRDERNDMIFTRLEEAVSVSMAPLERVFREAGLPPERILEQVRSAHVGPGERLQPIAISTRGSLEMDDDAQRVNDILSGLDRINLFRIASERAPFAEPVSANVRFTSGFGTRRDPKTGRTRQHNGVDFAGPRGTPIHATADGVVTQAGWQGGYGNTVIVRHAFGIETLYAHLHSINVREGQRVSRGDRIGGMGTTGRSTGVHLHYEVRLGGRPIDPMTYIRAARNVF
ncbi:peptidase M23 [Rhodobaculum claviforme]|uniref:Peptidase M23 n=1 Tax=Rhodobaculum claviforme TaxID=1549854 RepID=A0A934TKI5_9RHOB|nr:peptidase M23 [Rhodobaculum claviforme]